MTFPNTCIEIESADQPHVMGLTRDQCRASQLSDLSRDEYVDSMSGAAQADPDLQQAENRMPIADAIKVISTQSPKFTLAIILKEYVGLSVSEIADRLHGTTCSICFCPDQAKKTGMLYKRSNE